MRHDSVADRGNSQTTGQLLPANEHAPSMPTGGDWKEQVRTEADRLEASLYDAPREQDDLLAVVRVQASIDRARRALDAKPGIKARVTGKPALDAWSSLEVAREYLIAVESDDQLRADIEKFAARRPVQPELDREQVRQSIREQGLNRDSKRREIMSWRNLVLGVVAILTPILLITLVVAPPVVRAVIGIGAVTGLVGGVVALIPPPQQGDYGLIRIWAAAHIPLAAMAALLGVAVLHWGFGPLLPAQGTAAVFYAVAFGCGLTLLTGGLNRRTRQLVREDQWVDHGR